MPLSENEQNILAEIEKHLHESDPRLAREVSETTIYRHALGSLKWTIAGFLAGLAIMLGTLQLHFLLGFVGFLLMLVSALGFERSLRMVSKAGLSRVSDAIKTANPNLRRDRLSEDDQDGKPGHPTAEG